MAVEARFSYQGSGVLTGELVLDFKEGRTLCCRVRTPDITVAAPGASVMITLPPIRVPSGTDTVDVLARLHAGTGPIDLGFSQFDLPEPAVRSMILAVCGGEAGSGSVPAATLKSLLLSSYDPMHQEGRGNRLSCRPLRLDRRDLPSNALGFCAYDVLVLTADAVREISAGRWRAMCSWVSAGGAVCVCTPDQVSVLLRSRLEDLVEGGEERKPRAVGPASEQLVERVCQSEGSAPESVGVGLGQVVLLAAGSELTDLTTEQIRRVACSLWRVRYSHAASICAGGVWGNHLPTDLPARFPPRNGRGALKKQPPQPGQISFGNSPFRSRGKLVRGQSDGFT